MGFYDVGQNGEQYGNFFWNFLRDSTNNSIKRPKYLVDVQWHDFKLVIGKYSDKRLEFFVFMLWKLKIPLRENIGFGKLFAGVGECRKYEERKVFYATNKKFLLMKYETRCMSLLNLSGKGISTFLLAYYREECAEIGCSWWMNHTWALVYF